MECMSHMERVVYWKIVSSANAEGIGPNSGVSSMLQRSVVCTTENGLVLQKP